MAMISEGDVLSVLVFIMVVPRDTLIIAAYGDDDVYASSLTPLGLLRVIPEVHYLEQRSSRWQRASISTLAVCLPTANTDEDGHTDDRQDP